MMSLGFDPVLVALLPPGFEILGWCVRISVPGSSLEDVLNDVLLQELCKQ
jgi:hypothetical protein